MRNVIKRGSKNHLVHDRHVRQPVMLMRLRTSFQALVELVGTLHDFDNEIIDSTVFNAKLATCLHDM